MFPLNTILAWNMNIIINKKYDNNNIIIASRVYFLHFAQFFQIIPVLSYGHRAVWILFVAQSWALWHIRNKIAMENSFPNQPADCMLKTVLFLQQ
jgi:hypothetical protein